MRTFTDYTQKHIRPEHFRSLLLLWALTAASCLIIFYPFLFGEKLVVFNDAGSDTRQQYLMQYATIVNHLRDGSFSFFDLNNGFGTSMLSLNLFNPFLMLVYAGGVLLGSGHIAGILVYVIILEIFLAATFCHRFLCCFSFSGTSRTTAAYAYGMSGYLLVWGQHYQFGAFVVFLPLLLSLLESAVQRQKFSLTAPLLVAVMVCSSVYMSYMSLILAGSYLLVRIFFIENGSFKERLLWFLRHCACLLLGIAIGMAVFLPTAYYLLTISNRLDAEIPLLQRLLSYLSLYSPKFYKTAFLRFFSTTFQGIGDYNGYSNFYEAPVLFFSSLFVILAFQYIFTIHRQEAPAKKKAAQYLALLFFAFSLFVRLGAAAFNAFAYPFSRHSFLFLPLFALMTAFTLDQIKKQEKLHLPAFLLSCLCLAAAHVLAFQEITETGLLTHVIFMTLSAAASALLLFLLSAADKQKERVSLLLLIAVCANMCLEGSVCYNERDTLTTEDPAYWGGLYDPDVEDALAWLDETDHSLYRVEKDYYSGSYCMDALAQNYRGVSTYNSTPNRNVQEFIDHVTPNMPIMAEHEYTWRQIGYYTGHSSLFGIKYILSRNPKLSLAGCTLLARFGDICVYQNTQVASFARFYTDAGDVSVLQNAYGACDLERMLLETMLIDPDASGHTDVETAESSLQQAESLRERYALEEIPCSIKNGKLSGESVTIPLDRSLLDSYRRVYMEFDIRTSDVTDVTVNQELPLEYHFRVPKKKEIHVQIAVPDAFESVVLSRYGGDFDGTLKNIRLYGSRADIQSSPDAAVTMEDPAKDSALTGSIRAESSGYLFLPIPYEKGWTAQVDGKDTPILRADLGFVCVPIAAGTHTFSFTYHVPLANIGAAVSAIALTLWGALCYFRKRSVTS